MELSKETQGILLFACVGVLQESIGVTQAAVVHEGLFFKDDVISGEISKLSRFIEGKTRESTVLEISSQATKEGQFSAIVESVCPP